MFFSSNEGSTLEHVSSLEAFDEHAALWSFQRGYGVVLATMGDSEHFSALLKQAPAKAYSTSRGAVLSSGLAATAVGVGDGNHICLDGVVISVVDAATPPNVTAAAAALVLASHAEAAAAAPAVRRFWKNVSSSPPYFFVCFCRIFFSSL